MYLLSGLESLRRPSKFGRPDGGVLYDQPVLMPDPITNISWRLRAPQFRRFVKAHEYDVRATTQREQRMRSGVDGPQFPAIVHVE